MGGANSGLVVLGTKRRQDEQATGSMEAMASASGPVYRPLICLSTSSEFSQQVSGI